MKKILLFIILIAGFNAFSQEEVPVSTSSDPELSCDSIKYYSETRIVEFLGNVTFHSDILDIENARKIVLDQQTQEIVATGVKEFTFDGALHISRGSGSKSVRYKIGERIAYIE